ncbi:MAG: tRNA (adenosine(37)-N6)-dimethylallyltransferase MiaA [Candidatus Omnitrophica bacterium]|nr:tRNA (adenosine(37)-N6)-dimethylallyltransferase MiaA [Candidatus Omnitrophota bacterium]MBL7210315.1 tRNA (adenosine(37)-N6)-dimethylallyltransferase MiaA [Candidatus Omnitrophota bacterium]
MRPCHSPKKNKETILFLVGPTAAGKTEVGIELAKELNAEIISCDSMQIYKGMDIITSKPAKLLRKKIKHHLLDIVGPAQEYNVARYRQEAVKKIRGLIKKGKTPLFVGGTGLYMSVLIDGIFKQNSRNNNIRRRLYKELKNSGSGHLYKRLKRVDPAAAARIYSNDARRIIRALEVFQTTGRPISCLQRERSGLAGQYQIKAFCLNLRRDKLYERIEGRVEKMFKKGLASEVKRLLRCRLSKTASCAIGIKELKGYFAGLYDLEKAKELIKRNTRQYAKRQLTWFRKERRLSWIEVSGKETPGAIAQRIIKEIRSKWGQVPDWVCTWC